MFITDIDKIELNRKNYEDLEEYVLKFKSVFDEYKNIHKELNELHKKQNGKTGFFSKKNDYADEIKELMAKSKNLKNTKDNLFYQIKKMVGLMVSENKEYEKLYSYYLDCCAFNEEINSSYRYSIKLIKNKSTIDDFFNKLKKHIEKNEKISDEKMKSLNHEYKKILHFLGKVYHHGELKNRVSGLEKFEFNSDLNLSDAYTVLSIIGLLYTIIINPTYSDYKELYIEYNNKYEYIKKYNKKIEAITYRVLAI